MTYLDAERALIGDPDSFPRAWRSPKVAMTALAYVNMDLKSKAEGKFNTGGKFIGVVDLPMVHSSDCQGDSEGIQAHTHCKRPRMIYPKELQKIEEETRSNLLRILHPENLEFLQSKILKRGIDLKSDYLRLPLVADDHWEELADEPKLLTRVVLNPFLPERIALMIIPKCENPYLRTALVRNTSSHRVLSKIWDSAKFESDPEMAELIRDAVLGNSEFQVI